MEFLWQTLVTVMCSVLACSGFWTYVQKKFDKKSSMKSLIVGLAHDRIMQSSMYYIDRGYITKDEYENLMECLYEPYKDLGGNGSAEHMIAEINKLPVRSGLIIKGEDDEDQ